jgi:hypothetical protein
VKQLTQDGSPDDLPRRRQGQLQVEVGQPLRFNEEAQSTEILEPSSDETTALILTFRAYRRAAKQLLEGRYAQARASAPVHLREPCDITILKCSDGIIVRYDRAASDAPKVRAATVKFTLEEFAPKLTEGLLHFPKDPRNFVPADDGPTMEWNKVDMASGAVETFATMRPRIFGSTALPPGFCLPAPPARPPCLISFTNEFDVTLGGVILPHESDPPRMGSTDGTQFAARSRLSLPAAWCAIEVYPPLDDGYWKPDYAPLWAELDLQGALVQRNLQDAHFQALDSRGATRTKYAALLTEFEQLLHGPEEPVHQFLKSHPELLSPTHEVCWSKLKFGDYVSDFVIREPTNEYELVEIEAPLRPLFRKDGHPRQELNHAIGQIRDWVQFIASNRERVERELGLQGISVSPRMLVVIGRSTDLTPELREKLVAIQASTPKLRVLTYDDVLVLARASLERVLGPLDFTGQNAEFYFF